MHDVTLAATGVGLLSFGKNSSGEYSHALLLGGNNEKAIAMIVNCLDMVENELAAQIFPGTKLSLRSSAFSKMDLCMNVSG